MNRPAGDGDWLESADALRMLSRSDAAVAMGLDVYLDPRPHPSGLVFTEIRAGISKPGSEVDPVVIASGWRPDEVIERAYRWLKDALLTGRPEWPTRP